MYLRPSTVLYTRPIKLNKSSHLQILAHSFSCARQLRGHTTNKFFPHRPCEAVSRHRHWLDGTWHGDPPHQAKCRHPEVLRTPMCTRHQQGVVSCSPTAISSWVYRCHPRLLH